MNNFDLKISNSSSNEVNIAGISSPEALAYLLNFSSISKLKSNLVIVSNDKEAKSLEKALLFYNKSSNINHLPHFRSQMYSEVVPSSQIINKRLSWLYNAFNLSSSNNTFFIATLPAILQNTIPPEIFIDNSFNIKPNDQLSSNLSQRLVRLGYNQVPLVEDPGSFAMRGGILDIFSAAHPKPIRIELFGDIIESIKYFSPINQRSLEQLKLATIIPAKECIFSDENRQLISHYLKSSVTNRSIDLTDIKDTLNQLTRWEYFHGCDYFINAFYKNLSSPLSYFNEPINIWSLDHQEQIKNHDKFLSDLKEHYKYSEKISPLLPEYKKIFKKISDLTFPATSTVLNASQLHFDNISSQSEENISYQCNQLLDFKKSCQSLKNESHEELCNYITKKLSHWKEHGNTIFISSSSEKIIRQFQVLLENSKFEFITYTGDQSSLINNEINNQANSNRITILPADLSNSFQLKDERIIFLSLSDVFGKNKTRLKKSHKNDFKKAQALHFSDLKPGDFVVHKEHGVGIYNGLTLMPISGIDAEFLQLEYKGGDKLYLPIYRIGQIQKFTGAGKGRLIDKLGGQSWKKAKTKVKSKLKDIASDLLKLYAERSEASRPPFPAPNNDFDKFVSFFPYDETNDQLNAINHVMNDMTLEKPMDRLICGDVGFGKTEIAMRAAFNCVNDGRQAAIIAPTTILTFQHFENFKKRFQHWPFKVHCLNRFISPTNIKNSIQEIKSGNADIVIGTHRLFSKDIEFNNLGLLIIDEEQKFGVKHKEKIRSIKSHVDTLTLSATPIPRTLNMSFLGLRDLSLINTAPVDRLPIRTFICKYEQHTIKKAIQNEVDRGGQVFFLHNRVNNIETLAHELRELLPNIKFAIGHGQMKESDLEKVMVSFLNKEVDVLISTTIIESGMDIPNANTIIINNAQNLGLSQLYQLRGRVGRSSTRAYCYLMVPQSKVVDKSSIERLKVIQQNSDLGSGITIAQYDLELRGSGDLLGENQSGHVNTVGYELYMDLLKEAINEQKENPEIINSLEPELNLRIPALIPDKYISDIRLRLSYYKRLSDIDQIEDIDEIENDMRDQFGKLPEQVINLLGLMLIRFLCKQLQIKDLSQGKSGITLQFTQETPLKTNQVLQLTSRADNKYSLTPESRLLIKMKNKAWERIYEEIMYLAKICN